MTFLDVYGTRTGGRAACEHHPDSAAVAQCGLCGHLVCSVCAFAMGSATYCPACVNAPPGGLERRRVVRNGLASIGAAIVALLFTWAAGLDEGGPLHQFFELLPGLVFALTGASLALIARERARRTGSVLPAIGILSNAALVCFQAIAIARAILYG